MQPARLAELLDKQYNQRMKLIQQRLRIEPHQAGDRLDHALHRLLPDYSRSRIQHWIQQGFVLINHRSCKPRQKVLGGDVVDLDVPEEKQIDHPAQAIDFRVIHEDADIFVIDKPANLVVHPAAGHWDGTLVNGLLARDSRLEQVPRAGIVHRLDKDTTGIMVVARNLAAHNWLVEELQARRVSREYLAVAQGVITAGRSIQTGIARHPRERKKMSVQANGKPAVTHFQVERKYAHYSLIRLQLETGRTHQIRVHMAHIRHPLLGDPVYGGRQRLPPGLDERLAPMVRDFDRQALHARRLEFAHPRSRERVSFEADLPADLRQLLDALERYD